MKFPQLNWPVIMSRDSHTGEMASIWTAGVNHGYREAVDKITPVPPTEESTLTYNPSPIRIEEFIVLRCDLRDVEALYSAALDRIEELETELAEARSLKPQLEVKPIISIHDDTPLEICPAVTHQLTGGKLTSVVDGDVLVLNLIGNGHIWESGDDGYFFEVDEVIVLTPRMYHLLSNAYWENR